MAIVGKGPLVTTTELDAEPQILVTETINVPVLVTVIEFVVTVEVFHVKGPVPVAVNVTVFPEQIVLVDADRPTNADGPSTILIVRVIDPQELVKVDVYIPEAVIVIADAVEPVFHE